MIHFHGSFRMYYGKQLLLRGTLIDGSKDPYVTNRGHMTHADLIKASINKAAVSSFKDNHWGQRHVAAWTEPQPAEEAIVMLIRGAAVYADNHHKRFESKLGDDGVLGDPWAEILRSVLTLLNGDLGRLDGGTVDGLVRSMLSAEGFDANA